MTYKFGCVVDAVGRYATYVYVLDGKIQNYSLKEGEKLVYAKPPVKKRYAGDSGFVDPVFDIDASIWVEGATDEEMDAWDAQHPAPNISDSEPTQLDRVEAQATYTAMMTDTLLEG